jgi:hypothetical protein
MSVLLFPLFGYPLAKAEAAQICQRVAERLHTSSGGVLGRNECPVEVQNSKLVSRSNGFSRVHVGTT